MSNKQTIVYLHFADPIDTDLLHRIFPPAASFVPVMDRSCLISSYLTYRAVLELLEKYLPGKEYFVCVAGRHYHITPSS